MTEITILVPQIEQVGLMPNPADVDSSVTASVVVSEMKKTLQSVAPYCGTIFSGEGGIF